MKIVCNSLEYKKMCNAHVRRTLAPIGPYRKPFSIYICLVKQVSKALKFSKGLAIIESFFISISDELLAPLRDACIFKSPTHEPLFL